MPSGANILCPENARKSTPRSSTSTGRCGTDWQASSTTRAPTAWARSVSSRDRVHRAEHVGDVGEREHLGALGEQAVEVGEVEPAVGRDRHPAQGRAGAPAGLLPRDEVGVVLHLGDEHLVAGAEREPVAVPAAATVGAVGEGVGDEVDRLGGVAGEDDLGGPGPDEPRDGLAGRLVGVGALLGELVGATVHGGVGALVEPTLGVEHLARLVRGRTRVEVDERVPPAHGARQDREVGPEAGQLLVGEGGGSQLRPRRSRGGSGRSPRTRGGRRAPCRPPRRSGRRRRRARSRARCSAGCACSG